MLTTLPTRGRVTRGTIPASIALAFALLASIAFISPALAEAAPTPEQIDQGREVYEEFCQTCHGRDMVSSGVVTFDLRKFPKDDANRFRSSVLKGKGAAMPAFEGRIGDADIDVLWAYIRGGP